MKKSESPKEAAQQEFAGYKKVEILAPANDQTIWDNIGNISVKVGLAPDLQVALGHKVVLSVDRNPSKGLRRLTSPSRRWSVARTAFR